MTARHRLPVLALAAILGPLAALTVKVPNYGKSVSIVVKANGFAGIDIEVP